MARTACHDIRDDSEVGDDAGDGDPGAPGGSAGRRAARSIGRVLIRARSEQPHQPRRRMDGRRQRGADRLARGGRGRRRELQDDLLLRIGGACQRAYGDGRCQSVGRRRKGD